MTRAAEHIANLENIIAGVRLHSPHGGDAGDIGDDTDSDFVAAGQHQPLPQIVPILVSETVYNLRSALDYLVFELSLLNSGQVTERTQFPIESTPDVWEKRCREWLRALSDVHKAAIKRLQPFDGCAWTGVLRDMSNPDKHRHMLIIDQRIARRKVILHVTSGSDGGRLGFAVKADPSTPYAPMDVESRGVLFADAALPKDRLMVTETLHLLQQQVSDVVEAFDPDFQ